MTTKQQLFDSAVITVKVYRKCRKQYSFYSDDRKQAKAEAVAACQAYADYSDISYGHAIQMVMEEIF